MFVVGILAALIALAFNIYFLAGWDIAPWLETWTTSQGPSAHAFYQSWVAPWISANPYDAFALWMVSGSLAIPILTFLGIIGTLVVSIFVARGGVQYLDDFDTDDSTTRTEYLEWYLVLAYITTAISLVFILGAIITGAFLIEERGLEVPTWLQFGMGGPSTDVHVSPTASDGSERGIFSIIILAIIGIVWNFVTGLLYFAAWILLALIAWGLYFIYPLLTLVFTPMIVMVAVQFIPAMFAAVIAMRTTHPAEAAITQSLKSKRPDHVIEKKLSRIIKERIAGEEDPMALVSELSPARQFAWRVKVRKYLEEAERLSDVLEKQTAMNQADVKLAKNTHAMERSRRSLSDRLME